MKKYRCKVCGYIYDPAANNNVSFESLPDDWVCPECGVDKGEFEAIEQQNRWCNFFSFKDKSF